ncbi:hypothetical protein ACFFNY_06645 [Paenibacillus hodogayensis]|uniref:Uncharacterized protein n=1 Tax=Paenibacillus hodogayensis TaxID=279208 RepID=A0ABV5VSG4_9BACL
MKYYPLLVVGATFAGVGIAIAAKRETLIVEPFSQPGSEFISSYRPGEHWENPARTYPGKRLLEQLEQRNVLDENKNLHIPAVLPVWCQYICKEHLSLLLMTTITNITPHPDGYEVTMSHTSGLQTIVAGSIIDTTSHGLVHLGAVQPALISKSINAMIHNPEPSGSMPEPFDKDISFVKGRFDSELILKVELAFDADWISARRKLHDIWRDRPEALRPWTIAATADTFELHAGRGAAEVSPNWLRLPSCAYSNLLEAFEEGVLFAKHKGVEHEPIAVDQ